MDGHVRGVQWEESSSLQRVATQCTAAAKSILGAYLYYVATQHCVQCAGATHNLGCCSVHVYTQGRKIKAPTLRIAAMEFLYTPEIDR